MMEFTFKIEDHKFIPGQKVVVIEADGVPCGTIVGTNSGVKVLSAHIMQVVQWPHPVIDGYHVRFVIEPRRYRIEGGRKVYLDPPS